MVAGSCLLLSAQATRRSIFIVILAILLVVGLVIVTAEKASAKNVESEVVKGEYIIGFKNVLTASTCNLMFKHLHNAGIPYKAIKSSRKLGFIVIRTDKNLSDIKRALKDCKCIRYVEPAHYVHALYIPNDPYFTEQWGLKDINATRAWDVVVGGSIIVAVVDTGIDYTHPDLKPNYVPLGYDFVNNDTDPLDDNGHGTHCAGIIAAVINNSIGVAGVANVSIMAEKVLDNTGSGTDYDVALGIQHAVDNGAKIISMSLGSSTFSITLENACQYAWSKGAILVAASGNDGLPTVDYPAAYPEVIAVGSINSADTLSTFSNYGSAQELVAPGENILSTMPTYPVYLNTTYGYPLNYAYLSGTSMATPFVAGVAALTWLTHPGYTNNQIRGILNGTAIDLGTAGWDKYYGYGKVDAYNSVSYALQPPVPEHVTGVLVAVGISAILLMRRFN